MFIKETILVVISLYGIRCEVNIAKNPKDLIEYWKPEQNVDEKNAFDEKDENKNFVYELKSKPKKNERTSKWPKVSKYRREKLAQRITKMQMMQQEDTTKLDEPNEAQEESNGYFSPFSIKQRLLQVAKKIPNSNVTVEVIGRTAEYNDVVLLKITNEANVESDKYLRTGKGKYAEDLPEKKIIFIVHGLSIMGAPYLYCLTWEPLFLTLVSYYVAHLDKFDIFLIPMANPDGLTWNRAVSAVWNKNASPQTDCPGVALDRNFDVAWNKNLIINSCHQDYPGSAPFSEAESRAIRDVFHKYSHKIIAYMHVHAGSYIPSIFKGDAVLYPKGYTDSTSDDDKYIDLKGEIDEAMRNASFQVLSAAVDTLYNWYGKVSGSSVDYASMVYGIPFALELVMQLYEESYGLDGEPTTNYVESALTEVWQRIIEVIFNFIWKTLNGNEIT